MKRVFELFAVLNGDYSVCMENDMPMVYSSAEKAYKALNKRRGKTDKALRVERVYAADRRISK